MAKVFSEQKAKLVKPKRNAYDHSYQSLITGNYGDLMVVYAGELNPGESVKIDDVVAVRSHPVVFPVQTRMKAYLHYFAVRQRLLCDDFENMITGLDSSLTNPYIDYSEEQAKCLLKTGSLFDHLGVPTTFSGVFDRVVNPFVSSSFYVGYKPTASQFNSALTDLSDFNSLISGLHPSQISNPSATLSTCLSLGVNVILDDLTVIPSTFVSKNISPDSPPVSYVDYLLVACIDYSKSNSDYVETGVYSDAYKLSVTVDDDGHWKFVLPDEIVSILQNNVSINGINSRSNFFTLFYNTINSTQTSLSNSTTYFSRLAILIPWVGDIRTSSHTLAPLSSTAVSLPQVVDAVSDDFIDSNPFIGHDGNPPQIPLSAMYPRAYEMIYNYYYRNSQNNGYNPTGNKIEYNKFIPTTASGPDSNEYVLHRRNWELDPYTSAVPSPQFGDAPLVGMTYTGGDTAEFEFEVTNSETQQTEKVKARLAVDPDTGVLQAIQSFDDKVPSGNLRNLMDLTTFGFSINSLRNANAFQLFREDMFGHPLRYRDQLGAHFGVTPDYPDVDVPEFIGGTSGDLIVSQVTNMSESDNAPLGDIAGKIDAVFKMSHPVKYHAKEHTIILGILSLVPVPCYSQLLPKRLTRFSTFDYFQRRFGKIGYVPIFRSELMPLQSQDPDEVFGYQRAWYEYMSRQNEVHGDFRTSLSDFVLTRIFKDEPQLNPNFTIVDPDSVTNIFATDGIQDKYGSSDKFMIQVWHDSTYLSIIPKYARPALE